MSVEDGQHGRLHSRGRYEYQRMSAEDGRHGRLCSRGRYEYQSMLSGVASASI